METLSQIQDNHESFSAFYLTEEATSFGNISSSCVLATPKVSLGNNGNFIISGGLELYGNFSDDMNESVWIGYGMAYSTFQYIGKFECTS